MVRLNTTSEQKYPFKRPFSSVLIMETSCILLVTLTVLSATSSTIEILTDVFTKPTVGVHTEGGINASETLPLSFCIYVCCEVIHQYYN